MTAYEGIPTPDQTREIAVERARRAVRRNLARPRVWKGAYEHRATGEPYPLDAIRQDR